MTPFHGRALLLGVTGLCGVTVMPQSVTAAAAVLWCNVTGAVA